MREKKRDFTLKREGKELTEDKLMDILRNTTTETKANEVFKRLTSKAYKEG